MPKKTNKQMIEELTEEVRQLKALVQALIKPVELPTPSWPQYYPMSPFSPTPTPPQPWMNPIMCTGAEIKSYKVDNGPTKSFKPKEDNA